MLPFIVLAFTSKNIKYYHTQNNFIIILSDCEINYLFRWRVQTHRFDLFKTKC
jgi:hypothetical protein